LLRVLAVRRTTSDKRGYYNHYFKSRLLHSTRPSPNNDVQQFFIVALQPMFGPWSLFQFLNPIHYWRKISPSQGGYLHTGQYKHKKKIQTGIDAWNGIRTHDLVSERATTVHASDRAATKRFTDGKLTRSSSTASIIVYIRIVYIRS
jgi:hypothetical protein